MAVAIVVPDNAVEPYIPTLTLSPNVTNGSSIVSTSPDTVNTLVVLCSFQGFGPSWIVFDTGDVVKLLYLHDSGWCNVQRLSDNVVATVPHNSFRSRVELVSTNVADTKNDTSSPLDSTNMLEAICSIQGFGPDWLAFVAGDVVQVLDRHASGWWKVQRISDDALGVGPSNYFTQINPHPIPALREVMSATDDESRIPSFPDTVHTLEALYDFQSFDPGDLSCSAGDVVNVLRRNSNGWWNVRRINDDAIGVVPTNYFKPHDPLPPYAYDGPSPPPDIDEKFDQFEDTVEPRVPIKNHHTPSQSSSLPDLSPFARDTDEKSRTPVALHDFQGLEQDDLSFKAGDVVNVLRPQSAAPSSYFGERHQLNFHAHASPQLETTSSEGKPGSSRVEPTPSGSGSVLMQVGPESTGPPPVYAVSAEHDVRMDMLGEELADDSNVWLTYVDTAAAHDAEMVDGWNKSLDVLLLFASLFSAVVTAFVIESSKLIQPDYTQVNALLSVQILDALRNFGNASYLSSTPSSNQILIFNASVSGKTVNILWFAALSFSLAAVLVAMLAKQWLDAYMSAQKASPRESASERQGRFDGLHKWSLPHIMVLLPALLHISLFLFLVGLIIYMWQLDSKVSVATCLSLGVLFIFYFGSGAMAVFSASCPYVTPMSQFLRSFLAIQCTSSTPSDNLLVSKAVMWLSSTKDPKTISTALQALAGLRRRFVGYNEEQAVTLAKLALEHLRGCFVPERRHGGTYCLRTQMLYDASCYARTLMNFVDDSRIPSGKFTAILDDPSLPIFMQLLGTCSNSSMALLALCDYQRFLHRKELERLLSVRYCHGSYNAQEAGMFICRDPVVQNMQNILSIFDDYFKAKIFLQPFAIEIAIETMGFAPLPWVLAVSTKNALLEKMLAPLIRFQHETCDSNSGIRCALTSTLAIFAKVHEADRLSDPADDFSVRFEVALSVITSVEDRDQAKESCREVLLRELSYFSCNYMEESGELTVKSIFDELCHECDRRGGTEDPTFSDTTATETLLPLLLVPTLKHEQKTGILTRLQASAVSTASGYNLVEESFLFHITPHDPFPPDTVPILFATLEAHKHLTLSWLRDVAILLYLVTQETTHKRKLLANAPVLMELLRHSTCEEVVNHLFWIVTNILRQSISSPKSDAVAMLMSAGVLNILHNYMEKYGLTPLDVHSWVAILPLLPEVPHETPSRSELVQLMLITMTNQNPEQLQWLQNLRKPLLQFAVQPPRAHTLESALYVLRTLADTYPHTSRRVHIFGCG